MSYRQLQQAENKAREVIRKSGIREPPVPVDEIAKELGLDVIPYDFGEDISGSLFIENDKGFIGYNPAHSRQRRRFTIGHELGHYLMHRESAGLFVDRDFFVKYRGNNSYSIRELLQERQANAFAAALLMPAEFVMRELDDPASARMTETGLIESLARLFDVSVPAMTYRLTRLDPTGSFEQ